MHAGHLSGFRTASRSNPTKVLETWRGRPVVGSMPAKPSAAYGPNQADTPASCLYNCGFVRPQPPLFRTRTEN
jgi:hypothetical protein